MGLLDILTEKLHCEYLSNLRYIERPNLALRHIVEKLPLNIFPEHEWIEAANYLTDYECQTAAEAKDKLLSL